MVSVRKIEKAHWRTCQIWGKCEEDGRGGVFETLGNLDAKYSASRTGLGDILRRVAAGGFSQITDAMSHQLDAENQIFEFIKGDLRLVYFKDGGSVIVCTEAFVKKGQKTPKSKINAAIKFRSEYLKENVKGKVRRLDGAKKP